MILARKGKKRPFDKKDVIKGKYENVKYIASKKITDCKVYCAPIFMAAIETTTSGREVERAIKIFPTKVCSRPVVSAIPSPIFGRKVAAIITNNALRL